MPSKKELLNQRKASLLAELESIKYLLNDDIDNIPLLQETMIVEEELIDEDAIDNTQEEQAPHEPSTSTQNSLSGQQALFQQDSDNPQVFTSDNDNTGNIDKAPPKVLLEDNPFLPPHVRQRLNLDKATPTEESMTKKKTTKKSTTEKSAKTRRENIQKERAAWDSDELQDVQDEALLEKALRNRINNNQKIEPLIDQLVAKYLPQMEAELRQQLSAILNQQKK